ncbi:MAG: hypothetical protein QOI62_1272 [Solirubrobacteraceae bacterium]|nr:hypothetical protein [Solirubrobacteraceae bacterium]
MSRRRVLLVVVPVAVVAVVVAVLLLRGGSDRDAAPKALADEPLAYLPGGAKAVLDVDTRAPLVGLAVSQLAPRLSGGALKAGDVTPLLGGRAAAALGGDGGAVLALVAPRREPVDALARRLTAAGEYRGARLYAIPGGGQAALAARGATVVAGPSAALVRRALDARAQPRPARAAFDRRLKGLPPDAPLRIAFDPRALLHDQAPKVAATRWGRALRDGAAVLEATADGLRLPFRLTSDPTGLRPADLPMATGAQAPSTRGRAPLTIGLRTAAQGAAFAKATGQPALALLDEVPGFLRPDIGGLTGAATISSSGADLRRFTLVTDPPDPGDWAAKLDRLDALSGLIRTVGLADVRIDAKDGVYQLEQNGKLVVRAAVFGPTLALSDDARADLRAAARAPLDPPPPGAAGALTVRLQAKAARAIVGRPLGLPALVLDRLGDLTGWARAELDGVTGELRLPVR